MHPFLDETGIIRIKTKITERSDTSHLLYPIVLPSKHALVLKLIRYYHLKNYHVGVQGLLSILREKFWILSERKTVRSVILKYVKCRRHDAKPLDPVPVCLPKNRVEDTEVFSVTGVDLTGPLFLKGNVKVWVCIFTCAVFRAVHLELLSSLSTDSFLSSFGRFIARRGRPSTTYSDNGSNFRSTENLLGKLDWDEISSYSSVERIQWIFNPPSAAWWGGWWERLIRILKQLRKTLGRTSLNYQELSTVLCECEAILNNRPLTCISENSSDLCPLTPVMFLKGIEESSTSDIDMVHTSESLNRHLRYKQKVIDDMKKRFRIEYLGQLILRKKGNSERLIREGDVLLIGYDNIKRIDWPLAIVEQTFPGKDGNIRVVRLRSKTGILIRPVQKVYPLEVQTQEEMEYFARKTEKGILSDVEHQGSQQVTRSGRKIRKPSRFSEV